MTSHSGFLLWVVWFLWWNRRCECVCFVKVTYPPTTKQTKLHEVSHLLRLLSDVDLIFANALLFSKKKNRISNKFVCFSGITSRLLLGSCEISIAYHAIIYWISCENVFVFDMWLRIERDWVYWFRFSMAFDWIIVIIISGGFILISGHL